MDTHLPPPRRVKSVILIGPSGRGWQQWTSQQDNWTVTWTAASAKSSGDTCSGDGPTNRPGSGSLNPDEALAVARALMSRLEERWESWSQISQKPKHCGKVPLQAACNAGSKLLQRNTVRSNCQTVWEGCQAQHQHLIQYHHDGSLASYTQADLVVPTVPDSRDAVQVDLGGEAEYVDGGSVHESCSEALDEVDLECDEECAQVFVWAAGSEVQLKRELFRLLPEAG